MSAIGFSRSGGGDTVPWPDEPSAYYNLGVALANAGHAVEATQRYLEAKERHLVGSEIWAGATASAFNNLQLEVCA